MMEKQRCSNLTVLVDNTCIIDIINNMVKMVEISQYVLVVDRQHVIEFIFGRRVEFFNYFHGFSL